MVTVTRGRTFQGEYVIISQGERSVRISDRMYGPGVNTCRYLNGRLVGQQSFATHGKGRDAAEAWVATDDESEQAVNAFVANLFNYGA